MVDHRALVEGWLRRINEVGITDTLREITTPDVRLVNPDRTDGLEGTLARYAEVERAFPDAEIALEDVIADGNRLVMVIEVTGTHSGPLRNIPPTGKRVKFSTAFVIYLRDDRVERFRMYPEFFSAMSQMGFITPFEAPKAASGEEPRREVRGG